MTKLSSPQNKKEFAQYYHFRWSVLRQPWSQPQGSEQDELEASSFHFMLTDGEEIVAVARLHQVSDTTGQVRYVAVSPEHQGKGLGKQIMIAVEDKAQSLGLTHIELNARENALSFYLSMGYQNLGKAHLLYGEVQHYKMDKTIVAYPLSEEAVKLVDTWHKTIPMSKAMQIDIASYDTEQLTTRCDLAFNKNLHNTMFAGSISTLATLTGWGWIHLALAKQNMTGDIVLADGQIKYHAPIPSFAHAKVEGSQVESRLSSLNKGRKGRVKLTCEVYSGDVRAAQFVGIYVVLPKKED